jgi:hypothetical protein
MLHEGLLTKYIHIATVVAAYWYVYRLSFKYTECGTVRSGTFNFMSTHLNPNAAYPRTVRR